MMITVETEDKIRKGAGLMALFTMPLFASVIKNDTLKVWILIPLLAVMSVLTFRKFMRDKKEGRSLNRYYIAFGFVLLSLFMTLYFYAVTV